MSLPLPAMEHWALGLPNYIDPRTRVSLVLGVEITGASVAVIVVLLRLYCRASLKRNLAIDDWTMGLAMVISFSMTIITCLSLFHGAGYHIADYYVFWIRPTGEYAMIAQALFGATVSMAKISILLFYQRHFPAKVVQILSKLGIVFIFSWGMIAVFASIFAYSPSTMLWNPKRSPTNSSEHDINFLLTLAALNSASDLLVLVLPLPSLWKFAISGKQLVFLLPVFGLGLLTLILGILRILFLNLYSTSSDRPYDLAILYIVQASASDLLVISGSLLALQPLIFKVLPRIIDKELEFPGRSPSSEFVSPELEKVRDSLSGGQIYPSIKGGMIAREKAIEEDQQSFAMGIIKVGLVQKHIPTKTTERPPDNIALALIGPPNAPPSYPLPPIPTTIPKSNQSHSPNANASPILKDRGKMSLFPPEIRRDRATPKTSSNSVPAICG